MSETTYNIHFSTYKGGKYEKSELVEIHDSVVECDSVETLRIVWKALNLLPEADLALVYGMPDKIEIETITHKQSFEDVLTLLGDVSE